MSNVHPDWTDPLYLVRDELPVDGQRHTFGSVDTVVRVTDTDPVTVEASWSADREIALVVTDDVAGSAFASTLSAFREYATSIADRPTHASITLPSRDIDRAHVARAHGFSPAAVLAVASPPGVESDGVLVRDVTPSDFDAVAELWCEQTRYEARVGTLRTSDRIEAAIRGSVPLTVPGDGTALVAEVDGTVRGLILAQSVEASAWATGRLAVGPGAYLSVASTASAFRGRGVARALVGALHERYRSAGITASLLHYGPYNPLSVPFWSQCGYRPFLTTYTSVLTPASGVGVA